MQMFIIIVELLTITWEGFMEILVHLLDVMVLIEEILQIPLGYWIT